MSQRKTLDENGVLYLWGKIKALMPSKTSQLTNDSGYITSSDIPEGAAASTTTPKMDGTAAVGSEKAFARGDHVHPSDTSKLDTSGNGSNVTVDFSQASSRANLTTGEKISVAFGKIAKWFADLKTVAFTGAYSDLTGAPTKVSQFTNDNGYQTADDVESIVTGKGYQTAAQVETAITGKGYQTSTQVESAITSKGYQTASEVESAIKAATTSVYKPAGSVAFTNLPTPAAANEGNVYNVTDSFTTTASFVEGAGNKYPAGTNVVVIKSGTSYLFDVLPGFIDLSGYVLSSDIVSITNAELDDICV